jgi:hypothetical protein
MCSLQIQKREAPKLALPSFKELRCNEHVNLIYNELSIPTELENWPVQQRNMQNPISSYNNRRSCDYRTSSSPSFFSRVSCTDLEYPCIDFELVDFTDSRKDIYGYPYYNTTTWGVLLWRVPCYNLAK